MNRIRCVVERITFQSPDTGSRNHQSEENACSCRHEKSYGLRCEAYHGHKTEHKIERRLEKCLILWYNENGILHMISIIMKAS